MASKSNVDEAVKSIAYEYHWTPKTIKKLFSDDLDCDGIWFWYDECVRIMKSKQKSQTK